MGLPADTLPAWIRPLVSSSDDFELVVSGITLNRTSLSLAMGKSETLAVKQPFFGEAAGQAVTWSSDRADPGRWTPTGLLHSSAGFCTCTGPGS